MANDNKMCGHTEVTEVCYQQVKQFSIIWLNNGLEKAYILLNYKSGKYTYAIYHNVLTNSYGRMKYTLKD